MPDETKSCLVALRKKIEIIDPANVTLMELGLGPT